MKKQQQILKIDDRSRMAIKADGTKIPVKDSKFTFLLAPNKEDIEKGIPGDPQNCMYSRACRRHYDSELVWVTRTRAYLELKNRKGNPELHRFILKEPAQLQIKGFDKDKDVTEEAVIFAAPEGRNTLAAINKAYQQRKTQAKKSTQKTSPKTTTGKHQPEPMFSKLRAPAYGMFHFKTK